MALNTLVLSTTNNNDLQLNSLFTLASAQAGEDGEDGESILIEEVTAKPGEYRAECTYLSGFSVTGSAGFPTGVSAGYSANFSFGHEVRCTEKGDGCTYRECDGCN